MIFHVRTCICIHSTSPSLKFVSAPNFGATTEQLEGHARQPHTHARTHSGVEWSGVEFTYQCTTHHSREEAAEGAALVRLLTFFTRLT